MKLSRRARLIGRTFQIVARAIIGIAMMLGVVVRQANYLPDVPQAVSASRSDATRSLKGTRITLSDVDWSTQRSTVVLVLSTNCRFCTESAPFYNQLVSTASRQSEVRLIAVFPQEIDAAKTYLKSISVSLPDVRQASFGPLGISGTPTILLVDNTGLVTEAWVGRLGPNGEKDVLRAIGL